MTSEQLKKTDKLHQLKSELQTTREQLIAAKLTDKPRIVIQKLQQKQDELAMEVYNLSIAML